MNGNNGRPHSYELRRTMATAPRRAAVDPGRLLTRSYIKVWLLSKCVPLKDAFQGTLRSWPNLDQAFEGKTALFQKKVTKKGPKTGSGGMLLLGTISQFCRDFRGLPKIQVENSALPTGVKPVQSVPVKINKICYIRRTRRHTLAI